MFMLKITYLNEEITHTLRYFLQEWADSSTSFDTHAILTDTARRRWHILFCAYSCCGGEGHRLNLSLSFAFFLQKFADYAELTGVDEHDLEVERVVRSCQTNFIRSMRDVELTASHSFWPISSSSTFSAPSMICSRSRFPSLVGMDTRIRMRAR